MSNTKAGGQHLRETMVKRYGSYEAWVEYTHKMGSNGGKKSRGGGFADKRPWYIRWFSKNPLAVEGGKLGGTKSKRGKWSEQERIDRGYGKAK